MKRIRIGIFKGSNTELRQDLEICRQLQIPLLALGELRKELEEDDETQIPFPNPLLPR